MLNMYLLRIVKYRKKPKLKDQFERKKYNLIFYDAHMSNLRIQWLVTNTYITSTNDVFGSHIIRQIINRIRPKSTSIVNYLLYLIYVAITKEGIIDSDHNKNDAWIELHDFFYYIWMYPYGFPSCFRCCLRSHSASRKIVLF